MRSRACGRLVAALFGLICVLGGCSHGMHMSGDTPPEATPQDAEINIAPVNYKTDILGAMHAYLNDPTGIRDAAISEPTLKGVSGHPRYVVCVRYNAKKHGNEYTGMRELVAVFMVGRFDHFLDDHTRERSGEQKASEDGGPESKSREPKLPEQCMGAVYAPFPELQKLSR